MRKQQRRNLVEIGMDEGDAYAALLNSDNWIPTRSEGDETGGWFRMTHKRRNADITVTYDATRTVTDILVG